MNNMYLFLRKNRIRKKWQLYKRVFLLSFDMTLFFYLSLFLGYIIVAIIIDGNLIQSLQERTIKLNAITSEQFAIVITTLPLFYLFRAFRQPGVLFSKAEYILSILPHNKKHIWWTLTFVRWVQVTILFVFIGFIYYLFSNSSIGLICMYVFLLVAMNILMTVIEWKIFQLSTGLKIALFLLIVLFNVLAIFMNASFIALLLVMMLLFGNYIGYRHLMKGIDWSRVTAAVDFKIWNMQFIGYVTKIKFKKERKYTFWQKLSYWKKPFIYRKNTFYHRLWQLHFEKNMKHILQVVGALLLMIAVLGYLKPWLFLLAVILVIHMYTSFIAAMFKDRFTSDIVAILPWDLYHYRKVYLNWVYFSSIVLFIPILIYLYFHFQLFYILVTLIAVSIFVLLSQEILLKTMHLMDNRFSYNEKMIQACYIGLILIFCGYFITYLLYAALFLVIILLVWKLRGKSSSDFS